MIEAIKELRARTHLGMTACKKALEEAGGNIDSAIEILQKAGLKKVDDFLLPTEGMVYAVAGARFGHIVEINCQTDFGAKSEVFTKLVHEVASNPNVTPDLNMVSKQLGEKIVISRFELIQSNNPNVMFVTYNHLGKVAVLIEAFVTPGYDKNAAEILGNIAMQIAAMKPIAINRSDIPADLLEKKTKTFEEDVKFKPENVRKKIVEGKLNKWYAEVVLLEQEAIFDIESAPKQSVQLHLDKYSSGFIKLSKFVRYERGEKL